jgi:hypothetical protein
MSTSGRGVRRRVYSVEAAVGVIARTVARPVEAGTRVSHDASRHRSAGTRPRRRPRSAVSPDSPGGDTDQRQHDSPGSEHDRGDYTAADGEEEGAANTTCGDCITPATINTPSRIPPFVGVLRSGGTAGEVFDVFGESLGGEFEGFGHGEVWVEGVGDLVDRGPVFDCHDGGLDDVTGSVGEDVGAE